MEVIDTEQLAYNEEIKLQLRVPLFFTVKTNNGLNELKWLVKRMFVWVWLCWLFIWFQDDDNDDLDEEDRAFATVYVKRGFILNAPNLQRLVIHDLSISAGPRYFELLLSPFPKLTHLDLSGAEHREGFGQLVSSKLKDERYTSLLQA